MTNYLQLTVSGTACLLLVTSCSLNPLSTKTNDNTDISVSAESVGEVAFQSIDQAHRTQEILALRNPAPATLLEQCPLPVFSVDTKQFLGKKYAASEFSIDTIGDIIRITLTKTGNLQSDYDTIEAVLNETVSDGIKGNESLQKVYGATVYSNGTIESYHIEDLDGDGIINGTSSPQYVALNQCTMYTKDVIGHRSGEIIAIYFEADAGDDNLFDTGDDNHLHTASWVKTVSGDTLAYAFFNDADNDGIIAASGPGTIDVRFFEKAIPLKPLVEYGKANLRIERGTDGKERTLRFSAEEKFISGRCNRVWVVDENGDSTLEIGEKAYVHFTGNSPAVADSEISARIVFVIDPGSNFGEAADNLLHEFTLAGSYRFGRLDTLTFHATFDPPVPDGQDPGAGTLTLDATFRNGKSASLYGTFSLGTIEGTFTGPEGNETGVVLKRQ